MPWSAWIHTKFHVHRATQDSTRFALGFEYGAVTLFGPTFQTVPLPFASHIVVLQPRQDKSRRFGLLRFRSPLLTESHSLSFPLVTEMFHFTRFRSRRAMYSLGGDGGLAPPGYPIRTCTGQSVFAAIRALSQLVTSFIAYWRQGIHHVLFVA